MTKDERAAAVLRAHWDDCKTREPSLEGDDDRAIHAFRLACKRLRYAIELFDVAKANQSTEDISALTDILGNAHDCMVLARRATRLCAESVARHALNDRLTFLDRARAQWRSFAPALEKNIP